MNNIQTNKKEKKIEMRKFNSFYYVYRRVNIDNNNGINIMTEDIVQEIFLSPDECYNYITMHVHDLKNILWEYVNKTDFISKIKYLKDKLTIINTYFPDNIIFKYDCFDNDSSKNARKEFYKRLVMKTNEEGSVQIDTNTKTLIDKDSKINDSELYGIYIVPLNFDTDKINNR